MADTLTEGDGDTVEEATAHTLVTFRVPVDAFALADTLAALPDAEFECEQGVQHGSGPTLPLVWARGVDRDALEAALDDDPSVRRAALVERRADELLYRTAWDGRVGALVTMLAGGDGVVRAAAGSRRGWAVEVLFTAREDVSRARERCDARGVDVSVEAIRGMEGNRGDRYGLTDTQVEALALACRKGYFEVPRATDLDDLADALGLTHQSLSERIRRGHQALIESTIFERSRRY